MKTYTKIEALKIILATAKEYQKCLENKNFIFIYKSRETNKIEFFEAVFLARHFQHLCGVEYINKDTKEVLHNATDFYSRCISNELSVEEILLRADGTTNLKLEALPKLVSFIQLSKMTVAYNGNRPKLSVDRFAGTVNYSLGFTLDKDYYMPSSCLLEDIRNLGDNPSQILAILSKDVDQVGEKYKKIRYVAKGVSLIRLKLPEVIESKIDLVEYEDKT